MVILILKYIEYTYDTNDRLTFSQDGKQRSSRWMYYLYDVMGRLTQQGECSNKSVASSPTMLVQNYYDDYSFRTSTGFNNSNYPDGGKFGRNAMTASAVTILGSGEKIYKAFYYDIKGRIVKSVQNNLLSGYDITSTVYTFSGKPVTVTHTHTANGKTTRTEVYTYTYDHVDRVSKVQHTLGSTTVTLYDATYDNIGRLFSKSMHGSATNKLTYTYNLRSWLTEISGTKFTQNLYYNTGIGAAKYNGSISSMTWKSGDESTIRGYKFTYDEMDRMLNATYGETASINTNPNRFSENVILYDKNGNIKTLQRYGQLSASTYGLLDNLTYTLTGNQLNRVDDAVTTAAYGTNTAFVNGASAAGEYAYDANGNLTKDLNKGITGITYNILNLPNVVTFSDGSTITYTYGADGTKLRTVHKIGITTTTTDYCGNVIYENGTQKLLLTEEGYVNLTGTQLYHYYLKDHQGNNRIVINQAGTVEEANHYYPFGGIFASTNIQPYKYNGKELDTKKGLNWYDYGARHYDPVLGRWHVVDPMSEKFYTYSPYTYCLNSPVKHVDVNGEFPFIAGLIGGAIDYAAQVVENRVEGKSWSESLTDVDTKSIMISATTSMAGVGFANVIDKGVKAAKIVQTGTKVATAVKVASDVAVNGTISATSQILKDGEVSGSAVVADVAAGFIGGKVGEKAKSLRQNSAEGKVLSRQADHARRVAGTNPRASRAEKLRVATQNSQAYGDNAANAASSAVSSMTSVILNKSLKDDLK